MDKQLPLERDPLPEEFASLTEAGAFWDTHSTADYEDVMEDVAFEVNLTGKPAYYFAVAKDIAVELQTVAQQQGVSTQTLINLWLQEKLLHMANEPSAIFPSCGLVGNATNGHLSTYTLRSKMQN